MTGRRPPGELQAVGLGQRMGGEHVLDGVDLQVGPGEVRALVGLNGAGKSTLMRVLLGMQRPASGRAELFGRDVRRLPAQHWAQVGHLVEPCSPYPELTARQNVIAAATLHGMDRRVIPVAVDRALVALSAGRWADRRARTLSMGTRQKVGLASALVHEPSVLVLDEPTSALDPLAVVELRRLIRAAADRGAAVLVSSHHLDEMARMADAVTVLHRGRIVGQLPPRGDHLEQRFFDLVHEAERVETTGGVQA